MCTSIRNIPGSILRQVTWTSRFQPCCSLASLVSYVGVLQRIICFSLNSLPIPQGKQGPTDRINLNKQRFYPPRSQDEDANSSRLADCCWNQIGRVPARGQQLPSATDDAKSVGKVSIPSCSVFTDVEIIPLKLLLLIRWLELRSSSVICPLFLTAEGNICCSPRQVRKS